MGSRDRELAGLLSQFASTMLTDFPIQAILDQLVQSIVDTLPITAAGVTLISASKEPHYIAASNESALRFERLQTFAEQGPCLLAYTSGEAVTIPNIDVEGRFPRFGPAAQSAGMVAAFAFPLRHGDGRLGALDLYCDSPGPLSTADLATAQTLADVTAAYVLNAQAREEARQACDLFRDSSLHDSLTGLPNRLLLQQRLEHAAQRGSRSHTNAAVLFADLDRFKDVNDTHGHQIGDELLVAVADRLSGLVRPGDTLARVSGDEFVFLCEDLHAAADIEVLAPRIKDAFAAPFTVSGLELSISASVGMAYAGPGEAISGQLLVDADIAMYQAKRTGAGGQEIVDIRDAPQRAARTTLEQDLQAAFSQEKLDLAYQPIVRAADGLVTGVEALLRWMHPERGPIPAVNVIDIAEANGLIGDLGTWVLRRGCSQRTQWLRDNPGQPLDLAVNVSARQLLGPGFVSTVVDVLAETGMDPRALVLEMTETVLIEDAERAMTVLADLKELGIRLALDDFGTGYCSLSYLRNFPVDILKIDRAFTAAITSDRKTEAIIAAVTALAHELELDVIAEGVETLTQNTKLLEIGCESAQGFWYAAGLPAAELSALLGAHTRAALHLPSTHPDPTQTSRPNSAPLVPAT
ncbi:MAG: hypothetical protein JWN95_1146 [Frankiales bacterium]|nr:hypothetical protein [Frankiales bacterium]